MITVLAWVTIVVFMVLIMTRRLHPFTGLALVPIVFTAIGTGFGLFREAAAVTLDKPAEDLTGLEQYQAMGEWVKAGMVQTSSTAFLLLFAILFFSVMLNVGLFDPITDRILRLAKGDPLKVMIGTGVITALVSLSGDGTTTTLICCTALVPIFKRLKMRLMNLAVILILMNTILNLLPWSGPTARVLAVLPEVDPNEMLQALWPGMLVSIAYVFVICVIMGLRERKRLGVQELSSNTVNVMVHEVEAANDGQLLVIKKGRVITTVNAVLVIVAFVVLIAGLFEPVYIFLVGTLLAMVINFPKPKDLKDFIDRSAADALQTAIMVIAAGAFMGVFTNSGMSTAVAQSLVDVVPSQLGGSWALVTTFISAPGGFFLSNDAFFYGVLPVLVEAGQNYGFTSFDVGYASLMGQAFHMFSPLTAFIFLLLNRTEQELGKWQRTGIPWAVGIFVLLIVMGIVTGALPVVR